MHNILTNLFDNPWALALLAIVAIIGLLAKRTQLWRRNMLSQWGHVKPVRRRRRAILAGLGLSLTVIGIAGPRWGTSLHESLAPGRDLVIVLDLSRSMLAQDVLGRTSPNRLGRAIDSIKDLLRHIEARGGHRLGLIVFAAHPHVACPLTQDYDHLRMALASENVNHSADVDSIASKAESGTRIGAALRAATKLLGESADRYGSILLLSDGDDPAADDEWRQGIEAARRIGVRVDTVGIGQPDSKSPIPDADGKALTHDGNVVGTQLEERSLETIAEETGGEYIPARTSPVALSQFFERAIETQAARELLESRVPTRQKHAEWFFGGAACCFAVAMLFGQRRVARVDFNMPIQGGTKERAA